MSFVPILVAAALASVLGQAGRSAFEEDDRLVTRHGPVILSKAAGETPRWRVALNDRTLLETEDDELGLWELFEGDDARDYVIVKRSSGGIACPFMFRVIEAAPKAAARVSEEFGSCLEPKKTRLYGGDALVLEMPAHVPHPELLSPAERRRRQQTTEIYTVRDGKITKREEVRR